MSRREVREFDIKRQYSKVCKESSPKRSRRDGKPEAERISSNIYMNAGNHLDYDQKQRRRLQDALPLEDPLPPDPKIECRVANNEHERKTSQNSDRVKRSSNPSDVPRSRSYFQQHDERGRSAGQAGRSSFVRKSTSDGGWWRDARDEEDGARGVSKKPPSKRNDYQKTQPLPLPPMPRKRPAFREKKLPLELNISIDSAALDRNPRHLEVPWKEEVIAKKRFDERKGGFGGRIETEKWKRDMFEEGNRSPPMNEEDQIARVEALLGS